jgi:hypothetical protein
VIVTGDGDRAGLSRACEAGASFFLFKPVDRHCLLRLIRITGDSIQREERRLPGVSIRCKVSLELGQEQVSGWTLDPSLRGWFVQASRALSLRSPARVSVELKSGTRPLCVTARLVRVPGDNCMGLQIENAGPLETKRLQQFLLPLTLRGMNQAQLLRHHAGVSTFANSQPLGHVNINPEKEPNPVIPVFAVARRLRGPVLPL